MTNLKNCESAYNTISEHIQPSPVVFNERLSKTYGCHIYLKLENMLPVGSFKMRGALNKIANLSDGDKKRGVVAVSAGNHAQGVAWAASKFGIKAKIFMPQGSPLTKIQNTQELGAEVILAGENFEECYEAAKDYDKIHNLVFIHPYEDDDVIAGQSTIAFELMEQTKDIDFLFGSIGGGGLMAGVAPIFKNRSPKTHLVAAQASGADPMIKSLLSGKITNNDQSKTFCDGIKVKNTSEKMYHILKDCIDTAIAIDDSQTTLALIQLMEKAHIITEGAGALPLAAFDDLYQKSPDRFRNKNVVLIICGGNIDINLVGKVIDKGLIRSSRRLRLEVQITDTPGSLSDLTQSVSNLQGNILQVYHDNDDPHTSLMDTMVELTIETKGREHLNQIVKELRNSYPSVNVIG